jgi:hypothetical protein
MVSLWCRCCSNSRISKFRARLGSDADCPRHLRGGATRPICQIRPLELRLVCFSKDEGTAALRTSRDPGALWVFPSLTPLSAAVVASSNFVVRGVPAASWIFNTASTAVQIAQYFVGLEILEIIASSSKDFLTLLNTRIQIYLYRATKMLHFRTSIPVFRSPFQSSLVRYSLGTREF